MKRSLEEEDLENESTTSKQTRLENEEDAIPEETFILKDLQANLMKGDLNDHMEKRLFETQKQYFTVYMERLMNKMPLGKDIVNIITNRDGPNEFEYMFTAAKSLIQSQMRVKQIKAFHAVFDMVYGLVLRYVHEKVVSPALLKILSHKQLQLAYEKYQNCSETEEDGSETEFQCLLYCIQEMLENEETAKIPNPLYSRLTQQMKAMSEYIIALLVSMSKPEAQTNKSDFNITEEIITT